MSLTVEATFFVRKGIYWSKITDSASSVLRRITKSNQQRRRNRLEPNGRQSNFV